jgi:multisubunit Na+/H+ antiporter MnhE subunit
MKAAQLLTMLFGVFVWFGLIGRGALEDFVLGVLVIGSACWLTGVVAGVQTKMPIRTIPMAALRGTAYLGIRVVPAMVSSSIAIARACVARRPVLRGAIVSVELPGASAEALVALSFGIAASPDRQIVHIDGDARVLYVHTIVVPDVEALRAEFRADYERYIRRATP